MLQHNMKVSYAPEGSWLASPQQNPERLATDGRPKPKSVKYGYKNKSADLNFIVIFKGMLVGVTPL